MDRLYKYIVMLISLATVLVGCQSESTSTPISSMEGVLEIIVSSEAFQDGETIPLKYTCEGADLSPPLSWLGVPDDAQSFALIVDDPDAPGGTWVHWVLYNIPVSRINLPEGVAISQVVDEYGSEGLTDFGRTGYGGPCPPAGSAHRYFFKLYALDVYLELPNDPTKDDVEMAMEGHILANGELMGMYRR
jgi:hypothetical protein